MSVPLLSSAGRLSLKSGGSGDGLLDGAWWPRSRDLAAELPALTDLLDPRWGRITRVAVNPEHWPTLPRHVRVNGHVVTVGWFAPELDPHKMLLLSYGAGRWDLLVVPPETEPAAAARLMAAACERGGPPRTASALVAAERAHHHVVPPLDADEAWEYEGGAAGSAPTAGLAGR
ncbi:DUF5994 family protein [Streptomyces sp. NPDC091279]|uniref:DUF5994 family protein n=1 Tax=unclassified Streptomyces TaxID=2593676 RepID=UPI0037F8662A